MLPTFPVVVPNRSGSLFADIGSFNPAMLVHGTQSVTLSRPLPTDGTATLVSEVATMYDKEKAAVVVIDTSATLDGEPLYTTRSSLFIRGKGGWGGERGPSGPQNVPPERDPDHVVTFETSPDQALVYRLNGDRNPLHSDPSFAAMGGFDRPILHGLCTYGFTGRALRTRCVAATLLASVTSRVGSPRRCCPATSSRSRCGRLPTPRRCSPPPSATASSSTKASSATADHESDGSSPDRARSGRDFSQPAIWG